MLSTRGLLVFALFFAPLVLHAQGRKANEKKWVRLHGRQYTKEALQHLETDAGAAQEYFALKRRLPGSKQLPLERYLVARERAARMPVRTGKTSPQDRRTNTLSALQTNVLSGPGSVGTSAASSLVAGVSDWVPLGPSNVPGRSRALIFSPDDPQVMYTAGVSGGVWKSTDGAQHWMPTGDAMTNIAVTSLAIPKSNASVIYAGTGEGFGNFDAVRGLGIFKSTDAGATWVNITPATDDWHYVNDLVISARDPHTIYAATNSGVFRSSNDGATFVPIMFQRCTDLVLRPDIANADYLFAVCGQVGFSSSVFRTTDASVFPNWQQVLSSTSFGRISLAIAPSSLNIIYALVESSVSSRDGSLEAVYRSDLNGDRDTWIATVKYSDPIKLNRMLLSNPLAAFSMQCSGDPDFVFGQGWYDNVITVDPTNADRVWVGGVDLFRSDDGGHNWGLASYWWPPHDFADFVHADQHVILFDPGYNGTTNRRLWVTNDGGVFKTDDALSNTGTGATTACDPTSTTFFWQPMSTGLSTTQFYAGAAFPDGMSYFGGTQDNGTVKGTDAAGQNAWTELLDGDGGYVAIDPTNITTLYASNPFGDIKKSLNGGLDWTPIADSINDSALFIAPFVLDPSNAQRLWTGGFYMWRSNNGGATWQKAGTITPGNGWVSAIAVSPLDANKIIAGLSDGYIVSTGSGTTSNSTLPWLITIPRQGFVSSFAFDPADANTVYVTYSSFNSTSADAHVYKSTDLGNSWQRMDGAGEFKLPDIPVNSIVIDPFIPTHVYVATDIGVFSSLDGGLNWGPENGGFFNAIVEKLVLQKSGESGAIFAFTHGRGVYRTLLRDLSLSVSPSVLDFTDVFAGKTSSAMPVIIRNTTAAPVTIDDVSVAGEFAVSSNPCSTLAPGEGCTILVAANPAGAGKRTGTLSVSHSGSNSPYIVELHANGVVKFILTVDRNSIDFGNVIVGEASPLVPITLTNIGNQVANGITVSVGGLFPGAHHCPHDSLPPGVSCQVFIRFAPAYAGTVAGGGASIQANNGSVNQTIVISTSGTGVNRPISISVVSPRSVPKASPATTATLVGGGFTPNTTVFVDGAPHPVQYRSSTELGITLSAAEISQPKLLHIVAADGALASNTYLLPVSIGLDLQEVVWEPFTQQIYAAFAEHLYRVDPATGSNTLVYQGAGTINALTPTPDGKYIYFGQAGHIKRYVVRGDTVEDFATLEKVDVGPCCGGLSQPGVGHMAPLPDAPDSIVVQPSLGYVYSPAMQIAVYTKGTKQELTAPMNSQEFMHLDTDSGLIYNQGNHPLRVLQAVPDKGVQVVKTGETLDSGTDFTIAGSKIYTALIVSDAISLEKIDSMKAYGGYWSSGLLPRVDLGTNLIASGGPTFRTYNAETRDQVAVVDLSFSSPTTTFDTWGSGHFAFESVGGQTYSFRIPGDVPPANEAMPIINSVSQLSAKQNSADLILTITGSDFTGWSQARWNGADRETKWINANTLKVWVPWTDFAAGGVAQLTVVNAQGVSTPPITFTVIAGPLTFTPARFNFGIVLPGHAVLKSVSITNTSDDPVALDSISSSNPVFVQSSDCGTAIAPHTTCQATVTFTATDDALLQKGNLQFAVTGDEFTTDSAMAGKSASPAVVTLKQLRQARPGSQEIAQ